MKREEWLKRYRAEFAAAVPNINPEELDSIVGAISFEEASAHFEEDPEGAAQEEMSYWE